MDLVIDANVVAAYFKEAVLEIEVPESTDTSTPLIDSLGDQTIAYLDDGGQIENEWQGPVDETWFTAWYAELLRSGKAVLIPVPSQRQLQIKMREFGFPNSRDFWYIKTAKAVATKAGKAHIISEDIDFYCPKEKRCKGARRKEILINCLGDIPKHLRKREAIIIMSLYIFNNIR